MKMRCSFKEYIYKTDSSQFVCRNGWYERKAIIIHLQLDWNPWLYNHSNPYVSRNKVTRPYLVYNHVWVITVSDISVYIHFISAVLWSYLAEVVRALEIACCFMESDVNYTSGVQAPICLTCCRARVVFFSVARLTQLLSDKRCTCRAWIDLGLFHWFLLLKRTV